MAMTNPLSFKLCEWTSELGKKTLFEANGNLDILLEKGASMLTPKELKEKIEKINNGAEIRLYLDISGSMKDYLEATKEAAKALLKTVVEKSSVNIYTFDGDLHTILEVRFKFLRAFLFYFNP
jgi:Mg-chelatase subunit ChlD